MELVTWPALVGLIIGRLSSMVLESGWDVGDLRDLFILRGGVELVPGVAAAVVLLAWSARRGGIGVIARLADLTPYALAGLAGFQATCLVRDGCHGPASAIGLPVPGGSERVLPVELVAAVVLGMAAVWLAGSRHRHTPAWAVVLGVAIVAVERSVVAIWLPAVGDGLSRAHVTSIVIAALAVPAAAVLSMRRSPLIRSVAEPVG
ncbi:MAG: hypothetical protein ACR2HP_08635 [Ilumatobacteraceae bacterium]